MSLEFGNFEKLLFILSRCRSIWRRVAMGALGQPGSYQKYDLYRTFWGGARWRCLRQRRVLLDCPV